MAAQNPPFAIQADSHSAEVHRRAVASLLGGVTVGTPGGVVAAGDLLVTAGAGNSLSVAAGEAWIPGNSMAHMGAYYGYNDAVVNLGVTPNASNPLYAIVTASVNDQVYTGNPGVANNTWNLMLTQGTPAPSPTVPATPANSLLLSKILVPASAASSAAYTITDMRSFLSIGANQIRPPVLRVHRTAAWTCGNALAIMPFDTVDKDTAAGFSLSTFKYTVPVDGTYLAIASAGVAATAAGQWIATALFHNASQIGTQTVSAGGSPIGINAVASDLAIACVAGDTLYTEVQSSVTLAGLAGTMWTYLSIVRVGR